MIGNVVGAGVGATAVAAATIVGSGVAAASSSPTVVGQKYSDASSALSGAGYTPVVQATVGDRLPWPDCIVTHQQDRSAAAPPNSGGKSTSQTVVTLNCDAQVASAKAPGNSLGSPAGRAAAATATSATPAPKS